MAWGIVIVLFAICCWQRLYAKTLHKEIETQSRLIRTLSRNNEMLVHLAHNLKNIIYGKPGNKYSDPNNGGEGGGI